MESYVSISNHSSTHRFTTETMVCFKIWWIFTLVRQVLTKIEANALKIKVIKSSRKLPFCPGPAVTKTTLLAELLQLLHEKA